MGNRLKKYRARVAKNEEGSRLQVLVDPDEVYPEMNWNDINPWWVVALDEHDIVACAQVVASKPVGHVEYLALDPALNDMQKAYAIKTIVSFAWLQMQMLGVNAFRSAIPHGMRGWKKMVKRKYGGEHQIDAGIFEMRIQ